MQTKQLHFNKPQLRSQIIGAPVEVAIMGRGTGKSEGILAPKSAKNYLGTMPRGTGVMIGATYNQILTKTLPAIAAGWERLGYVRDVHYLVGRKPPEKWVKKWKWQGPYRQPFNFQYFISWWNGGGVHLVSQDRQGSSNGITIDWIIGDEAKLLNADRYRTELLPANRGVIPAFKNNPYHHGITLTSDMPVGTAGRWLLDYETKIDREKINEVWRIQTVIFKLKYLLKNETRSTFANELKKQLAVLADELNELRQNLLYYHEASTLDNIHALGLDYIKQQIRDTTAFQFDTQILNLRPLKLEDGFYPDLDEEHHGYFAADNGYLETFEYDFNKITSIDCRRDGDLNYDLPLHMSMDYNRRIHPLVVAQTYPDEIRFLNGLYSLYPGKLREAINIFCDYYAPLKRKQVYYWFDHTAVGDQHESRICDDVINLLTARDWSVIPMYTGVTPDHEVKYRMWGNLLGENGTYEQKARFNRENCDKLILSMYQAPAEQRKDGFGKDKKSERDENFPADEATHFSEAADTLVHGILESGLSYSNVNEAGETMMGV
jgi:hypothetical protein